MKVTFRCGFGSHMFVLYWYLQVFMFFSLPASISLKPSFYICSPGSFQVTWSFQYLSQLFGQVGLVNCFATRSPKHMTLAFQQCHLQVCLWRHQGSTHCVPATTTPGFFLDLTFFANSFLLCETCFFKLVVSAGNATWASFLHYQSEAESCNRCSNAYAGW